MGGKIFQAKLKRLVQRWHRRRIGRAGVLFVFLGVGEILGRRKESLIGAAGD
jgi:hypothetical protein